MTDGRLLGVPASTIGWILGLGVVTGVLYTLSPVSVVAVGAFAALIGVATNGAGPVERRWLCALLGTGIALRLAVIAALFASTNHAQVPFAFLFGDEELFIRRSLWMRNLAF